MCRDLEIDVIAEGIENETTLGQLLDLNCFIGQGYYFAKPMDIESLLNWHRETKKLVA